MNRFIHTFLIIVVLTLFIAQNVSDAQAWSLFGGDEKEAASSPQQGGSKQTPQDPDASASEEDEEDDEEEDMTDDPLEDLDDEFMDGGY